MDGDRTETAACLMCKNPFERHVFRLLEQEYGPSYCASCSEQIEAKAEEDRLKQKDQERESAWKRICPPLYQNTDLQRLSAKAVEQIESWTDDQSGRGLAFYGASGKGKTRLAFALCRHLFLSGKSVAFISGTKLAQLCVECFDDEPSVKNAARARLRDIRSAGYLLLDDLGKQKFTDRAEMELYDVIETRTSHLRPTFWTANCTGDELAAMLSTDRGEPIIRRLAEFSTVVAV